MSARTIYRFFAAIVASAALYPTVSHACQSGAADDDEEANIAWPSPNTTPPSISSATSSVNFSLDALIPNISVSDPTITDWKINPTAVTGQSPDATINNVVDKITADVNAVAYTSTDVYVRASGVPSHSVGPFTGNPAAPSDRNRTFDITRTPTPATGTHTATGLGAIGVMINGVPFFNASDGNSYNSQNVWHQNANVVEAVSFDSAPGHPAPLQGATGSPIPGVYHYHQDPVALLNQLDPGNTGQHASPLLGFAFDGYPIYGPYAPANADGTGPIIRMTSSYQVRNITQRNTLSNGTTLTGNQVGPTVSTQYPLGYYLEDYSYVAGSGDLDQYNGRTITNANYPDGTYAYFVTADSSGKAAYPYIIGPNYYGNVLTDNLGQSTLSVPNNATYFFLVPEPAALSLFGLLCVIVQRRRRA